MLQLSLAAIVPLLLMSLLFGFPGTFGRFVPGTGLATMGYIVHAEFLAAASGILVLLPLLFPVSRPWHKALRLVAFMLIGYGFAWMAYNIDGTWGMLAYVLLVFVTFGGGSLAGFDRLSHVTRTFLSLLRWSVAMFVYVSWQLHFDLDVDIAAWKNTPEVITFGSLYFFTLCLCEVLLYPVLTWHLEAGIRQDRQQEAFLAAAMQTRV